MRVTLTDGSIVNITVDFSKEPGSIDKNGYPIFTSEEEIDRFIETGEGYTPIPDPLDTEANNLLINNLKEGETFETVKNIIV